MDHPDVVVGVTSLRADGFAPIEELAGEPWLADPWPEVYRCAVSETRVGAAEMLDRSDGLLWMIRSPWEGISTQHAVDLMWEWLIQHDRRPAAKVRSWTASDTERHVALAAEFLALDQRSVQAFENTVSRNYEDTC